MVTPPLQFPPINKTFVKGLFWLAVFLFLASIFSSFRIIYDNFLKKPEVRQEIILVGPQLTEENSQVWSQRAIVVQNRGNADARNVFIRFAIPNGKITRVEPYSDEPFYAVEPVVSDSRAYSLTRLAAGARILLLTWFVSVSPTLAVAPAQMGTGEVTIPIVSTTFDGGTAETSGTMTALEEMQNVGRLLLDGLRSMWYRFEKKLNLSDADNYVTGTLLPALGISYTATAPSHNQELLSALIAIGMLAGFAWLLLRRVWAGLVTAAFSGLFLWLYFDVQVDVFWLIVPMLLSLVALVTTKSRAERVALSIVLIGSLSWLLWSTSLEEWSCVTNGITSLAFATIPTCSQVALDGGLVFGLSILAAYLIFVEL